MPYVALAARICLSLIFIRAGINHLTGFGGFTETIANLGVPLAPVAAAVSVLLLLAGSTLLLLGFKTKVGAILLIIFLIPTTLVVHNPLADPAEWTSFMKNIGLIGGLLMTIVAGPGAISLDGPDTV